MSKAIRRAAVTTLTLGYMTAGAFADQAKVPQSGDWMFESSVGLLNGRAQEFVFRPSEGGRTVSLLNWDFDNVLVFNGGLSYQIAPWLRAGGRFTTNLSGSSHMSDYDFNIPAFCPPPDFNCFSHHPATKLRNAFMGDIYLAGTVYQDDTLKLEALAGYKADYFKWQAYDGLANYSPLLPSLIISYEQWWGAPYVGVAAGLQHGPWSVDGRVIGSIFAKGHDRDHHHLSSFLFKEKFGTSNMIQAAIDVGYRVNSSLRLKLGYQYQLWALAKGPGTVEDLWTGDVFEFPGKTTGGRSETHLVSLGATFDVGALAAAGGNQPSDLGNNLWSGAYLGIQAGAASQRNAWRTTGLASFTPDDTANASLNDFAAMAGLFAGYQTTSNDFVYGIEFDANRTTTNDLHPGFPGTQFLLPVPLAGTSDGVYVANNWNGSLRLRAGMLLGDNVLLYGTGGLALGEVEARTSCSYFPTWCSDRNDEIFRQVRLGWTAGGGMEANFAGGWFGRAEYRFTDLGKSSHEFFTDAPLDTFRASIRSQQHQATIGFGYRLN